MSTIEIVLLVLGIIAFILSFLISDKSSEKTEETISKEKIQQLVEEEYGNTKEHLQDMVDETVSYSIEKAERSLERITNEKILALGEYSDTIMNQISTNHQETVFMYDMLSTSKEELMKAINEAKKNSGEANSNATEALAMSLKALEQADSAGKASEVAKNKAIVAEEKMLAARKAIQTAQEENKGKRNNNEKQEINEKEEKKQVTCDSAKNDIVDELTDETTDETIDDKIDETIDETIKVSAENPHTEVNQNSDNNRDTESATSSEEMKEEQMELDVTSDESMKGNAGGVETIQMALQKATKENRKSQPKKTSGESIKDVLDENMNAKRAQSKSENKVRSSKSNNNDQILKLHKQGMTNMEIAQKLGLGVGEVKLVIDLYEKR